MNKDNIRQHRYCTNQKALYLFLLIFLTLGLNCTQIWGAEFLWGTVNNFEGENIPYIIYTTGIDLSGQMLSQGAHGDSLKGVYVKDSSGNIVTDKEKALNIVGSYQDYLFIKHYDYESQENIPVKAVNPQEYGLAGSLFWNDANYFRYMLPYDPEQNNQNNNLLGECNYIYCIGLSNTGKRSKMWKEVFIHNILQRPIHEFMDDIDKQRFGSDNPLYPGRYRIVEANRGKTGNVLKEIGENSPMTVEVPAKAAQILLQADNYVTIAEMSDIDTPNRYISWSDFETLVQLNQLKHFNDEAVKCLDRFKRVIPLINIGMKVSGDVFQGIANHAAA